jgi:lipoate-protein ligase A
MTSGLLIIDDPAPGPWNMAVDQAILDSVQAGGPAVLRFYRWDRATLSFGYFQGCGERLGHAASSQIPVVRRSSGGGAIVHDCELTYSLSVPVRASVHRQTTRIYRLVHDAIIAAADDFGIRLERFADTGRSPTRNSEQPFLCFQRRTDDDLILAGYKVVGSAQRRASRAVLQHGSILIEASPHAPELPGMNQFMAKPIDSTSLVHRIANQIAERIALQWRPATLPQSVIEAAGGIRDQRFGAESWTFRRP